MLVILCASIFSAVFPDFFSWTIRQKAKSLEMREVFLSNTYM